MRPLLSTLCILDPFSHAAAKSLWASSPRAAREIKRLNTFGATSPRMVGWLLSLLFVLVLSASQGTALAQTGPSNLAPNVATNALRPARLYVIVSSRILTSVNRNDAVAAIKAAFEMVGNERGFQLDTKIEIINSVAEMMPRLENGSVDLLILDFVDFLQLESSQLIAPGLVGTRSDTGKPRYPYLLLVSPSSSAVTIAELRGKKLNYFSRNEANTALAWLDVVLNKEKLGSVSSFFASFTVTDKPQACILPLFFGTIDACVVDEINLELQKELNPQLGKLRVLARSTPIIENVIATPTQTHPYQDELLKAILSLHTTPRGKQILMVFKTGRLVRISPADIEVSRALWTEYGRLTGSLIASTPEADAFSLAGAAVRAPNGPITQEKH